MLRTAVARQLDREAEDIIAASRVSADQGDRIRATVRRLKEAALWDGLASLQVYANETSTAALVDWVRPTLSASNGGAVFTAFRGFQGNGTSSYVNTNVSAFTRPVVSNTSLCWSVWPLNNVANNTFRSGCESPAGQIHVLPRTTGNAIAGRCVDTTLDGYGTGTVTDGSGLITLFRRSITAKGAYRNGAQVGAETGTNAGTVPDLNLYVGANNQSGNAVAFDSRQHAMSCLGAYRTVDQELALYSIMRIYMTSIGAP